MPSRMSFSLVRTGKGPRGCGLWFARARFGLWFAGARLAFPVSAVVCAKADSAAARDSAFSLVGWVLLLLAAVFVTGSWGDAFSVWLLLKPGVLELCGMRELVLGLCSSAVLVKLGFWYIVAESTAALSGADCSDWPLFVSTVLNCPGSGWGAGWVSR